MSGQPTDAELFARVLAKTHEYLDFPSVVGHETPFLDHLARDFEALGARVERPRNLCVAQLGDGPVYLAHIDRHGAITAGDGIPVYAAHAVKNEKYAESQTVSASFAEAVSKRYAGETIFAYDRKTGGRIAYGRITGAGLDARGRLALTLEGMIALTPGTPVAFARSLGPVEAGFVSGQLDNPVSAAALRVAAEFGLKGTVVFTAEEEIGRSAAHALSWFASSGQDRRDIVVLDTTPFDDSAAALAGAVILRRRDATASFNPDMVRRLEQAASTSDAPIIFKDSFIERENDARARRGQPLKSMGLTELGRIAAMSAGRCTGATLQIPTFNYHSNQESTTPRAITAFARTLLALE
ncbi:hypothetical protein F1654_00380 [Alkalicaulis satelles]|uniref:M42 family metallopeptidase n=1 Tax=Alkalicaulis satelles TaxID=2609175 RepID=A0A5M6ZI45_9PROT|nr:hypothetical protein [Alkalicaulis satelles]KAA5804502.1 hypothetical protein F1654_00380 [Alkalicaulis satelles]